MKYLVIENQPNGNIFTYDAESKRDALNQFCAEIGRKYKFTSNKVTDYFLCLSFDWYRYNFSKMSNIE